VARSKEDIRSIVRSANLPTRKLRRYAKSARTALDKGGLHESAAAYQVQQLHVATYTAMNLASLLMARGWENLWLVEVLSEEYDV